MTETRTDTKPLTIEVAFAFGDIVFQRVNSDRRPGMVIGISIRKTSILYDVAWPNGQSSWHNDYELTAEWVPDFSTN